MNMAPARLTYTYVTHSEEFAIDPHSGYPPKPGRRGQRRAAFPRRFLVDTFKPSGFYYRAI